MAGTGAGIAAMASQLGRIEKAREESGYGFKRIVGPKGSHLSGG